jgi:hypothetical protein
MISILVIGFLIALAAYFMMVKTWGDKPKKARKQEKSEIIRQLLALSEQENRLPLNAPLPGKLHASRRGFVNTSRKS